ncbi:MAG: phospholipid carrier-dependent glycosyltransferase [Pyrinomonadaceae bacterium]
MNQTVETAASFSRHTARLLRFAIPALLPFLFLIVSDWKGLDYGVHWDEVPYQVGPTRTMVTTGTLLPGFYQYPSFSYWLNAAALIPELAATRPETFEKAQELLLRVLDGESYLLRLRKIYLLVSALTVIWIYLLAVNWQRSRSEALLASAVLALSWEVSYHLRWIATDGLLMQFGALTILFVMQAWTRLRRRTFWLRLAALAAGCGCGAKYPGGLLIVPVLVCAYLISQQTPQPRAAVLRPTMKLILIFVGAYLVCTPGTLLQPGKFIDGLLYEVRHYGKLGHGGHTIAAGLPHAWAIFVYLSTVLFSHYSLIALFFFALALVGVYALIRESRHTALLFLCFPFLYLLFFSLQRVMVVRNLLVVAPFMALMTARGAAFLGTHAGLLAGANSIRINHKGKLLQAAFAVLICTCFLVNAGWLAYAAQTIVDRHTDRFTRDAVAYISTRPENRFFLSPRASAQLSSSGSRQLANVTDDPAQADTLFFYLSEALNRKNWPAYTPALTKTWFGAYEVNLNYYPYWSGDDRLVAMSMATARKVGIQGVDYGSHGAGEAATVEINKAMFVSQSALTSMIGGQNYNVTVTMKNTGATTWTTSSLYRLGAQNPQDNPAWGRIRVELPEPVAPGAEVTFNFDITAPVKTGQYNFQWRMVQDGTEWFGDYTPNRSFTSEYTSVILRASTP